ncbi:RNA polymerase II C-terminal domain kinase beta subunit [Nowakowskiella sp. JEL0407]|nr:RNA polymerase II C-terminal domain kinase beta subunit [Nowakowskiella sp. JEL0407]
MALEQICVSRQQSRYFVLKDYVDDSRSIRSKTTLDPHWPHRLKASALMTRLAAKLGLPYYTVATAHQIFHRYFTYTPYPEPLDENGLSVTDFAVASLFLAGKIDETIKKIKEVMTYAQLILHGMYHTFNSDSQEGEDYKKKILSAELLLLETTGFYFQFIHPHPFLIKFAKKLKLEKFVAARAWLVLQDSYQTTVCTQYTPQTIALAALMLANRYCSNATKTKVHITGEEFSCNSTDAFGAAEQMNHLYLQLVHDTGHKFEFAQEFANNKPTPIENTMETNDVNMDLSDG